MHLNAVVMLSLPPAIRLVRWYTNTDDGRRGLCRMSVVVAVVHPSTVVLVPEVGRGRERPAVKSIAACRRAGRLLGERQVESLLLLTPSPDEQPTIWLPMTGTFDRPFQDFEAPELVCQVQPDRDLAHALTDGDPHGWQQRQSSSVPAAVLAPLYFLDGSARLPVLPIGVSAGDLDAASALGDRLAAALARADGRIAVVAAGTLSSKVFPGAPGGYHSEAAAFDAQIVEALIARDDAGLRSIGREQRTAAGERLLPQLVALLAAVPAFAICDGPVYEAPFGEGYLTATLAPPRS
jgi:hypothetical protein